MDISSSHHFDRPFADVWAMLIDPDAHVAKYQHMGHRDVTVSDAEPAEDGIDITIVRQVDIDVPGIAKKFINPSNTVTSQDRWQLDGDGSASGRTEVDIKGVPVQSTGRASLSDDGAGGCDYTVELTVKVKVPMVGEKVAGALKPQLVEQLDAEFSAAEAWLTEH
jgi:carbon monoxide dehydrogenase subunit G